MKPNPYDHVFREVAETRREVKPLIDLRECDSCKDFAKGLQPFDGRRLCETCRMAAVNESMRQAARRPLSVTPSSFHPAIQEPAHV